MQRTNTAPEDRETIERTAPNVDGVPVRTVEEIAREEEASGEKLRQGADADDQARKATVTCDQRPGEGFTTRTACLLVGMTWQGFARAMTMGKGVVTIQGLTFRKKARPKALAYVDEKPKPKPKRGGRARKAEKAESPAPAPTQPEPIPALSMRQLARVITALDLGMELCAEADRVAVLEWAARVAREHAALQEVLAGRTNLAVSEGQVRAVAP